MTSGVVLIASGSGTSVKKLQCARARALQILAKFLSHGRTNFVVTEEILRERARSREEVRLSHGGTKFGDFRGHGGNTQRFQKPLNPFKEGYDKDN